MTSQLQVFSFENHQVQSFNLNNELFLRAIQLAEILGYKNPRDAVKTHVDKEDVVKYDTLTKGGKQKVLYVNESGMYALILGSTLDTAKRFKKWVTSEVLPTIRKTGSYSLTINSQQQHAIREAVSHNVGRTGRTFQAVYHDLYMRFQIPKYQDLLTKDFDEAIQYLGTPQLEQKKRYDFPIETADPHDRMFANAWMTPRVMLDKGNRAPDLELLEALQNDGYDVTGAKVRIYALYNTAERFFEMRKELQKARQYLGYVDCLVRNSTYEKGINIMFYGEEKGTGIDSYAPRFL